MERRSLGYGALAGAAALALAAQGCRQTLPGPDLPPAAPGAESQDRHLQAVVRDPAPGEIVAGASAADEAAFLRGRQLFQHVFTPADGLGPLFNDVSCVACHNLGASGGTGTRVERRLGAIVPGPLASVTTATFIAVPTVGGTIAQVRHVDPLTGVLDPSLAELPAAFPAALAAAATAPFTQPVISLRTTTAVMGNGLLSAVPLAQLRQREAAQAADPALGISGRVNNVPASRNNLTRGVGRLGWKAQQPDNPFFGSSALLQEQGISTPFLGAVNDVENQRFAPQIPRAPEVTQAQLDDLSAYCALLAPPLSAPPDQPGFEQFDADQAVFEKVGCAVCHYAGYTTATNFPTAQIDPVLPELPPSLQRFYAASPAALAGKPVPAYTDLLLHDMGTQLADGFAQGLSTGAEWRTAPLWGLRFKNAFMHDSRVVIKPKTGTEPDANVPAPQVFAANRDQAMDAVIQAHAGPGSEANAVVANVALLGVADRIRLYRFLNKL